MPSIRGSIVSSTSRLLSSSGSFLPVSIHQPASTSWRTRRPWSISHWMASVISSSPRADGSIAADRVVDVGVEEVDADEREVGRRVVRLLDQPHHLAVGVEHGDAELARVVDVREQDLRRADPAVGAGPLRALASKRVDELRQALLEHVVAEVHHEVVVAEEVARR